MQSVPVFGKPVVLHRRMLNLVFGSFVRMIITSVIMEEYCGAGIRTMPESQDTVG